MKDIFGREIENYCIVAFPFVKRGSYMDSKVDVKLSYGIMKGKRIYTLDTNGLLVYKIINKPESMVLRIPISEIPKEVMNNINIIKDLINK